MSQVFGEHWPLTASMKNSVVWLGSKIGHKEKAIDYIAYGNEASSGYAYSVSIIFSHAMTEWESIDAGCCC